MDRRQFINTLGIAGAGLGLTASCLAASPIDETGTDAIIDPDFTETDRIRPRVKYEWSPLREVVVGYPLLRLSNDFPPIVHKWLPIPPEYKRLFKLWLARYPGKTLEEISLEPDVPKRIRKLYTTQVSQVDGVISLLRERGIIVHQIPALTADEQGFLANLDGNACQLFPRDPILVVGTSYLELPLFLPYRRRERFPIRRAVQSRVKARHANIRSAPEPYPMKANSKGFGPSAFLEGGDVLVFDKRVLVGISGNASNREGVAWLRKQLGPSYAIETVPLKENFLHLDVALCTPRPGLAVVCKSAFPDGLPSMLNDWDLIEVDEDDALKSLACNALVLDHTSIIVVDKPSYVAERLEEAGQTVYRMPFDRITPLGGGFRCWHHPLIRA